MLNELKKQKHFCFNMIARDVWLAGKNYNRQLPKVRKMAVTDNFNMPEVKKKIKVTAQS